MGSKLTRREFFRRSSAAGALVSAEVVTAKGSTHPPGWAGTQRTQEIATNCEMCFWRCGVLAEVADGKVVKLSGNPAHPLTTGRLCAKGCAGTALLYDPDRLKYPMLRTGARGEGKFKRITWDEALDVFAARLNELKAKYGPESVAFFPHGVAAVLVRHADESLRYAKCRRAGLRAMPRSARSGLRPHVRPGAGFA